MSIFFTTSQYSTLEEVGKTTSLESLVPVCAVCNCCFKKVFHCNGIVSKTLMRRKYSAIFIFLFCNTSQVFSLPVSFNSSHNLIIPSLAILFLNSSFPPVDRFHMTSRRPYWCTKTMKRRPCWCPKPILWELNSFLM